MDNRNYLIFDCSYVIRTAIKSIILSNLPSASVFEYDKLEQLQAKVKKHDPECVFIGSEWETIDFNKISEAANKTSCIAICRNSIPPPELSACDELLFIDDSKEKFNKTMLKYLKSANDERRKSHGLSKREEEIVHCVACGMTNNEIGEKLFLSLHTIKTHRKNISKKLGINSASGLTVYAIMNNIISLEEAGSSSSTSNANG